MAEKSEKKESGPHAAERRRHGPKGRHDVSPVSIGGHFRAVPWRGLLFFRPRFNRWSSTSDQATTSRWNR